MISDRNRIIVAAKALEEFIALNTACRRGCSCNECELRGELRYAVMRLEVENKVKAKS